MHARTHASKAEHQNEIAKYGSHDLSSVQILSNCRYIPVAMLYKVLKHNDIIQEIITIINKTWECNAVEYSFDFNSKVVYVSQISVQMEVISLCQNAIYL